jgi:hypothetical protein
MRKYSDKFLNQTNKLKNAKVGMEFEFYMKDISYYKTLELLNKVLNPVKVWGFRQYHSNFTPDEGNFKIEPDLSGGSNMVELVTGPMNFYDAKYYLIKIIKFIQNWGYTNDKCSIHFNISFDDEEMDLNDLNILKLILNIDEEEIYRAFPARQGNVYAKSIKSIIPYKEYDFFNIPISTIKNNLRIPNDKYYGVNFLNILENKEKQRLEFRYIGGKDYEKNIGQVIYFMERFIINSYDCIDTGFDNTDISKLEEYLEDTIKKYKNLSNYDNFIVEFPDIQIQIDQVSNYDIISSFYDKVFSKIFNLIDTTEDLKECIINYVTRTQTLEVVDATIKTSSTIKGIEFINCDVEGIFNDCFFLNTDVLNSQITKSGIQNSEVTNSKVFNCNVDSSTLENCYFQEGYLNGEMRGGIYRSGKLGPYAQMDSEVKIVTDYENFFDTRFDPDEDKGKDKGIIKAFGKGDIQK